VNRSELIAVAATVLFFLYSWQLFSRVLPHVIKGPKEERPVWIFCGVGTLAVITGCAWLLCQIIPHLIGGLHE
jgi:hypothetical protein